MPVLICFLLKTTKSHRTGPETAAGCVQTGGLGAPEAVVMETRLVPPDAVAMETDWL